MLDRRTFSAGLAFLASVFERLERVVNDKFLSNEWYKMLSDLTDEEFKSAVMTLVRTCKYTPTIADIREAAKQHSSAELSAEEAWAIVLRDVREKGYYQEPHYSDWRLEEAKNAIGWETLCDMGDNKEIVRAHFMRIYNAFCERQKQLEITNNPQVRALIDWVTGKRPALEGGGQGGKEEKKALTSSSATEKIQGDSFVSKQ